MNLQLPDKDFWRNVRRRKSIEIKGSTYHFVPPHFNYKEVLAPLSFLGIGYFEISPSTASKLKNSAVKQQLLEVKNNYGTPVPRRRAKELCLDYNDKRNNIVF